MMRCHGATHPGKRRENNEDTFLLLPHLCAAVLADGMGGQNCGEVGSAITVQSAADYLVRPEPGLTPAEIAMEAIRHANRQVLAAAQEQTGCNGMGSTVVLAYWACQDIVIANVGDSRGYLFRDGLLRQLSYDQNLANELRMQLGLSEERIRTMPNRNVLTMAVGTLEHVLIRTHVQRMEPGDRYLLCSDGLCGPVTDPEIAALLRQGGSLESQVQSLIDCANRNGGPDNVTAVLLEYDGELHG
jgi:serine/threonine protein phosphatase PrpC